MVVAVTATAFAQETVDRLVFTIDVQAPGRSTRQLEDNVVRPIEHAVAFAPGARGVRSTVTAGRVATTVQFDAPADAPRLAADLQRRLDAVQLPRDAGRPTMSWGQARVPAR